MEQEIILEGIHAMLEEIRDNMKKNPELETMKSKLSTIEKVCNEFARQKFVTEEVMAQFLACTLQRIMEKNEKQDEKVKEVLSKLELQDVQRPIQKHLHTIEIKSSKVIITLVGLLLFLFLSLTGNVYQWKENIKLFNNDIKYRYIKACDGIDSKTLRSLETIFEYEPDKAQQKSLRQSVEDFERKAREQAAEFERARLEEKKANQLLEEAKGLKRE